MFNSDPLRGWRLARRGSHGLIRLGLVPGIDAHGSTHLISGQGDEAIGKRSIASSELGDFFEVQGFARVSNQGIELFPDLGW